MLVFLGIILFYHNNELNNLNINDEIDRNMCVYFRYMGYIFNTVYFICLKYSSFSITTQIYKSRNNNIDANGYGLNIHLRDQICCAYL